MSYQILFYQSASGRDQLINLITAQKPHVVIKIRNGIRLLQEYGLKLINISWVKKLKGYQHIYELRIKADVIIRIIFVIKKPNRFILLHLFIKKSNKTPLKEIKTAIKRAKDIT